MLRLMNTNWDVLLPWKCASQTLRKRLEYYIDSTQHKSFYFNEVISRVKHEHHNFSDYLAIVPQEPPRKVAAFIRNPYDRVVSGFMQLCRDAVHLPKIYFADTELREYVLGQVSLNTNELIKSGYDVNRWFQSLPYPRFLDSSSSTFLLNPAHLWTHLGDRKVDFIGKVENFELDFETFIATSGLNKKNIGIGSANLTKPLLQVSEQNQYRYIEMLQPETIMRINKIFFKDFELFGYPIIGYQ